MSTEGDQVIAELIEIQRHLADLDHRIDVIVDYYQGGNDTFADRLCAAWADRFWELADSLVDLR